MKNMARLKEKFRKLYEKYKEWDHPSGIEWAPIERKLTINGKRIKVRYEPHVKGYLRFTNEDGEPYDLTKAGAFATMNSLWDALKDVKMDRVYYELNPDETHFKTKEKWYAREMIRHGYEQIGKPKRYLLSSTMHYFWKKKQERKPPRGWGGLEREAGVTSIIMLIISILFLSSNLTGNVIGSLNQASSNWIGGVLFIIGIIGVFTYFKKFK